MSTNAASWFYHEPERSQYLITERLNGTFWGARIVEAYWKCTSVEEPFQAVGYIGDQQLELAWVPNRWLALHIPDEVDAGGLVEAVSRRVLAIPAACTYKDPHGRTVYEWHTPQEGKQRWNELQGRVEYGRLKRL